MKIRVSALVFGIVAAAAAVCVQVFWSFSPPQAYGVCVVCHARDLINAVFSQFSWYGAPISTVALKGLMLTIPGIILGALIMALINREWKLRFVESKIMAPILGFTVMTAGLIISGCPMRLLLRTGYGDLGAMAAGGMLIVGVFCGTMVLKLRAKRQRRT